MPFAPDLISFLPSAPDAEGWGSKTPTPLSTIPDSTPVKTTTMREIIDDLSANIANAHGIAPPDFDDDAVSQPIDEEAFFREIGIALETRT